MDDMKLYEAINHIDDDLIDEASVPKRRSVYYTSALSAAVFFLLLGISVFNGNINNIKNETDNIIAENTTVSAETSETSETPETAETGTSESRSAVQYTATTSKNESKTIFVSTAVSGGKTEVTAVISENTSAFAEKMPASTVPVAGSDIQNTITQQTVGTAVSESTSVSTAVSADNTDITVTTPAETNIPTDERNIRMKKIINFLSAVVIANPVTADIIDFSNYKDPAEYYAGDGSSYTESVHTVSPAEQELFDRIDKGLIDIDIDRNGELDMRDAALLYSYEIKQLVESGAVDKTSSTYVIHYAPYEDVEFKAPSQEAMDFLETREDIRNKDIFRQSGKYSEEEIALLDTKLIIRYHWLHTAKEEYLNNDYYLDTIGYNVLELHPEYASYMKRSGQKLDIDENSKELLGGNDFVQFAHIQMCLLSNVFREEVIYPQMEQFYDVNGDGVFDLHDAQDIHLFQYCYSYDDSLSYDGFDGYTYDIINYVVEQAETYSHVNKVPFDITPYYPYPDGEKYLNETIWNNCIKLMNAQYELESKYRPLDFTFVNHCVMVDSYLDKNEFKLLYIQPEYYSENRPSCENQPIPEKPNLYDYVKSTAGQRGLIKSRLNFSESVYDECYKQWSNAWDKGTAEISLDFNNDGTLNESDYQIVETYINELLSNTPSDSSSIPAERSFFETSFDLDGNGISGDIVDAMVADTYILTYNAIQNAEYGNSNCDDSINIADAVLVYQTIASPDNYTLSEQGRINADVCNTGDGVTMADALEIQLMITNK